MQFETSRFGMRFWGAAAFLLVSSVGCFGVAAHAAHVQGEASEATGFLSVTDALRQVEQKNNGNNPKVRVGVMTERLRHGEMTERVRPNVELIVAEGN